MQRTSAITSLATAVLALAALPPPASAQEGRTVLMEDLSPNERVRVREAAEAREAEADDLLRRARSADEDGETRKAARLYRTSAELRHDGDPRASRAYGLAARAYHHAGDPGTASRMAEAAALRALSHGDVFAAAESYIEAGVAAGEDGQRERASNMGWKAYRLLRSDALEPHERELLRDRLVLPPSLAAAPGPTPSG